jgi:hypothetical protein
MSRKNNVNPDYYKLGGRNRVSEPVAGGKGAPGASKRDLERAAKAAARPRERHRAGRDREEGVGDRETDGESD